MAAQYIDFGLEASGSDRIWGYPDHMGFSPVENNCHVSKSGTIVKKVCFRHEQFYVFLNNVRWE